MCSRCDSRVQEKVLKQIGAEDRDVTSKDLPRLQVITSLLQMPYVIFPVFLVSRVLSEGDAASFPVGSCHHTHA